MDTNSPIYSNSFRITSGALETQLLFKLESPVINEANNSVDGSTEVNVADIRLNSVMAKELYLRLKEQIETYEQKYGVINCPVEKN